MTSDFLSSISPGWVVMFLDSHRTVLTFLCWLDLLGVALAFFISILKIFLLQTTDTGLQISQASKNIWKVLQAILWAFIYKFDEILVSCICFWRKFSTGLLRCSSLQTNEGQMRSKFRLVENSQTSSTSKVWPSDYREDHRSCACMALL